MTETPEVSSVAWSRSLAYAQLARLFAPPAASLPAELREQALVPGLASALRALHPGILEREVEALEAAAEALAGAGEAGARAFAHEHTRLFLGPGRVPAPPFESVYRTPDRLMMGWPASAVASLYREVGLEPPPHEPPDSLVAELQFMALLAGEEAVALDADDDERADAIAAVQERFLREHLLEWAPLFARDLTAAAPPPLLAAAGGLLPRLLQLDQALLRSLVA